MISGRDLEILGSIVWLLAIVHPSRAQHLTWLNHYGTADAVAMNSGFIMAVGESGYVYSVGSAGSPSLDVGGNELTITGLQDLVVMKFDSDGEIQWAKAIGAECPSGDMDRGLQVVYGAGLNGILASGTYSSTAQFDTIQVIGGCPGQVNMFIASFSESGDCQWAKGVRGTSVFPTALVESQSLAIVFGDAFVSYAQFDDMTFLAPGAFMACYDADGYLVSTGPTLTNGSVRDAVGVEDELVICGWYQGVDTLWEVPLAATAVGPEGFVARVDTGGTVSWLQTFVPDTSARITSVKVTDSGKIYLTGRFLGRVVVDSDTLYGYPGVISGMIACLNSDGSLNWAKTVKGPGFDGISDVELGVDGTVFVQGRMTGDVQVADAWIELETAEREMYVAELDSMGHCVGIIQMGRVQNSSVGSVVFDDALYVSYNYDSTLVVDGTTVPVNGVGVPDIFIAKFDSLPNATAIQTSPIQCGGTLHIYANPNKGECTIDLPLGLRFTPDLRLTVRDQAGQVIMTIPIRAHDAKIALDVRAQALGIYHVELSDGRQRFTGNVLFE